VWLASACITVAFFAFAYIVAGCHELWLAIIVTLIGGIIMLVIIFPDCFRIGEQVFFHLHSIDIGESAEAFKHAEEESINASNFSQTDARVRVALGELFSAQAGNFVIPQIINHRC
jgi:hypothetical protein